MKYLNLVLLILLFIVAGCKKDKQFTTNFTIDADSVYIDQELFFYNEHPNPQHTYDFGDGNTKALANKVGHAYTDSGTYIITIKGGGQAPEKKVYVYPGTGSIQIKNAYHKNFSNPYLSLHGAYGGARDASMEPLQAGHTSKKFFIGSKVYNEYRIPRLKIYYENKYRIRVGFLMELKAGAKLNTINEIGPNTFGTGSYALNGMPYQRRCRLIETDDFQ